MTKANTPSKRDAQEPSSNIVEFPAPSRWAKDRKEHTKKICTFAFEQVNHDHELSAHARSVAIDIAKHVNWEKGYAEVSTLETAKRLGYTEKTVIDARDQVVARGHFEFTPGKAGRGHSARYQPILKLPIPGEENLRAAQYSDGAKTCVPRQENLRSAEIKPAPDAVEQSYNNLSNNRAASPLSIGLVDRVEKNGKEPAPIPRARVDAAALLEDHLPFDADVDDPAVAKIFNQMLDNGFTIDNILAAADRYTASITSPNQKTLRAASWLRTLTLASS
jgi:hypothetical protein